MRAGGRLYLSENEADPARRGGRRQHRAYSSVATSVTTRSVAAGASSERFSRIDVIVNNIASRERSVDQFENLNAESVERTFRTNVMAMFTWSGTPLRLKPGASSST